MNLLHSLLTGTIENQEAYRLWYEYLKLNKDYEKICYVVRESTKLIDHEHESLFMRQIENLGFNQVKNLTLVFWDWGDVHNLSWEEKLCDIQQRMYRYQPPKDILPFPNLPTFFPEFSKILRDPNFFTIGIPLNVPIDDLMEQIRLIISKKQEELKINPIKKHPRFPLPSKRLSESDLKNLRRYLEVYHLREVEKLNWKDVIQRVNADNGIHKSIHLKVWQRERDNARDIIENVGKNIFPGEYGQVKERKR
ncbi:MAG: hypothetical protein AB1611_14565 [bacterium]